MGRSASVKSTRISDEAVEMLSPQQSPQPIGDFATLAATPATSVAPAAELATSAPKRTRAGARSQPPSLALQEDSPARGRASPANMELRQLVEELAKGVKAGQEERAADRAHIGRLEGNVARLEGNVASLFKDSVMYTDKAVHSLRSELDGFASRADELMQATLNSVANLADLDARFKTHLETAFSTIEKEFMAVKSVIERGAAPAMAPPGVQVHRLDSPEGVFNFEEKVAVMERLTGLEMQVGKTTGLVQCTDGSCHCPCVKHLLSESTESKRQLLEVRAKLASAPLVATGDALLARINALERASQGNSEVREPPTKAPFFGPNGEGAPYPIRPTPGGNSGDYGGGGGFPGGGSGGFPGGHP